MVSLVLDLQLVFRENPIKTNFRDLYQLLDGKELGADKCLCTGIVCTRLPAFLTIIYCGADPFCNACSRAVTKTYWVCTASGLGNAYLRLLN